MSGFRKCCDCRETHLLCDLPRSQVCAVELVLPEYFVPIVKTLRECLVSIGDFLLESLFCAQRS